MKTKSTVKFAYVNGLKQNPKDLDFHITPVLTFSRADKYDIGDLGKAWSIGLEWGHWAIAIGFFTAFILTKQEDKEREVMYDSPEAAYRKTVTGWVSRHGQFWGDNEHMARYNGCTHTKCNCGNKTKRGRSKCPVCEVFAKNKRYHNLPFKEWDHKTPLALYNDDVFFFDEDAIIDYLDEYELNPEDLQLVYCRPEYLSEIDGDYWTDSLPEDGDFTKEFKDKLNEFNRFINKQGPVSWFHDKYKTEYKSKND